MPYFSSHLPLTEASRIPSGKSEMTKAIDVCLVNDEIKLAEFRIGFLDGLVFRHYFFEAEISHGGQPKPLIFAQSHLAEDPRVTIVSIPIPEAIAALESRWAIEEYSRDWAMWFVAQKYPDHPIILADIDEIPSREQIQSGVQLAQTHDVVDVPLDVYYRYANLRARERWRDTKMFLGSRAQPGIRFLWGKQARGERGAHFRYLGYNLASIQQKYQNFAHSEYEADSRTLEAVLDFADVHLLSHVPRFHVGDFGLLSTVSRREATAVQIAVQDFFSNSWLDNRTVSSRINRTLASFWMNKWLVNPSKEEVPLSEFVHNRLKLVNPLRYWALLVVCFHLVGVAKSMRLLGRIWASQRQKIPGRTLVHRLRGVYRHGDFRAYSNRNR